MLSRLALVLAAACSNPAPAEGPEGAPSPPSSEPVRLDETDWAPRGFPATARFAIDGTGATVVSYPRAYGGAFVARRVAGQWGQPTELHQGARSPIELAPLRNGMVANWQGYDPPGEWHSWVAWLDAGGEWSAPHRVDADDEPFWPSLAVLASDGVGRAWLAGWQSGEPARVVARSIRADRALGERVVLGLGDFPRERTAHVALAMNASGDAVAVWRFGMAMVSGLALARARDDAWMPAVEIADPPGQDLVSPRVGLDGGGVATVAWLRDQTGRTEVVVARAEDTSVGARLVLERDANPDSPLELAVEPNGRAVLAWIAGSPPRLRAAHADAAGVWSAAVDVATGNGAPMTPQLALDPDGGAALTWTEVDRGWTLVYWARTDREMTWSDPAIVWPAVNAQCERPIVTIDPAGLVRLAWAQFRFDPDGSWSLWSVAPEAAP